MNFPWQDYDHVLAQCRTIIADRDAVGRNAAVAFYQGFPHGAQDVSFELSRRVQRILGAEQRGHMDVAEADALDLVNYAVFYVMVLRQRTALAAMDSGEEAKSDVGLGKRPSGNLGKNESERLKGVSAGRHRRLPARLRRRARGRTGKTPQPGRAGGPARTARDRR